MVSATLKYKTIADASADHWLKPVVDSHTFPLGGQKTPFYIVQQQ